MSEFDLVVREETLAHERRTIITPDQLADLTHQGFKVALAKWNDRIYTEEEYQAAVNQKGNPENFKIIEPADWKTKAEFSHSIILGVKEVEEKPVGTPEFALTQTYVHFDHSFKGQFRSSERLARFGFDTYERENGENAFGAMVSGALLDHEYCTDEKGVRTHAFGKSAGFGTAAMSLLAWVQKVNGEELVLSQYAYEKREQFFSMIKEPLQRAIDTAGVAPKILILGGEKGRSAIGAQDFIDEANMFLDAKHKMPSTRWGRIETSDRQTENKGLAGVNEFDIVLNCTFTAEACPPFINEATIAERGNKLQILGDVTCDATPDKNRFRLEKYITTDFDNYAAEINDNIFLITVDHSPSFFPRMATRDMAEQFFPHLQELLELKRNRQAIPENSPWSRALSTFQDKMTVVVNAYNLGVQISEGKDLANLENTEISNLILAPKTEKNIKMNLAGIGPLTAEDKKAYFYYLTIGMMKIHEYTDMAETAPRAANPVGVQQKIALIQSCLEKTFDIESLSQAREVKIDHAVHEKLKDLMHDSKLLKAFGFNSIGDVSETIQKKQPLPELFTAFQLYASLVREGSHSASALMKSIQVKAKIRGKTSSPEILNAVEEIDGFSLNL